MCFLAFLSRSLLVSTIASALAVAAVVLAPRPAAGDVVFSASGTSSIGSPVAFQATLSITGSNLKIVLENLSPKDTTDAAEVLTSFYFDIWNGTSRPELSCDSASGYVFQVNKNAKDIAFSYSPQKFEKTEDKPSNLVAKYAGDATWQFLPMNPAYAPNLGFGIGTVANNGLKPNDFTPAVVGPAGNDFINFGIYKGGDINPIGVLNNKYLVKNTATFNFTGVGKYTENDIRPKAVFGLGTGPDSIVVGVPEPGAIVIAGSGALVAVWQAKRRRMAGWKPAPRKTGWKPAPRATG